MWQLERGRALRIEDREPFTLHMGFDGWQEIQDRTAKAEPFGIWSVVLTADELARYSQLNFTRRYAASWENVDHIVQLEHRKVLHVLTHST